MRCLCSGKSNSYIVTTVKTPVKTKISAQRVVKSGAQNGITSSPAGNLNGQAATTTALPINDVPISPTTEVQIHNDEVTRYQDTAKTVANEYTNKSPSKNSTPEDTLKKKQRAPQPKSSGNQLSSSKTSETQASSRMTHESNMAHTKAPEDQIISSHKPLESQVISKKTSEYQMSSHTPSESQNISQNASESQVTFKKSSEDQVTLRELSEDQIISQNTLENKQTTHSSSSDTQLNSHEASESHTINQETSGQVTIHKPSEIQMTFQETSESQITSHKPLESQLTSEYTLESQVTSHNSTESQVASHKPFEINMSSSQSVSVIESAHTSIIVDSENTSSSTVTRSKSEILVSTMPVTQETAIHTSSTLTGSKSETSLLAVPSPTNSLSRSSSTSSIQDLTTSTTESIENLENLIDDRKKSVGELLAGSGRSSTSVEENEARRRSGLQVSVPTGPEITSEEELPIFKKSPEDEEKIRNAIKKNEFLSRILSGKRLQDIINAMQPKNVIAKQKLIKQGDEKSSEMFVSKEGTYKILIKGKVVGEFSDTRVFGELAILYKAKRLASIQAASIGKVWVLDRHVYQKIVISSNLKEQDENLKFLQNVDSLNVVDVEVLRQVSNLLKTEFFVSGTAIIRQGDKGDKFYIIRAGTVTISKTGEGVLGKLGKGQCFGEMALQKEDTRQATVTGEAPGVECLTLTRADFINHFGDVDIPKIEVKKTSFNYDAPSEYQDIKLEDLKIVKTLGVGGFGRVELVQHKKKRDHIFALKYLKKIDIVYQNQQEHVYNEKLIQMNSRSPFIVRLYRTYKDNKYVYFLMESCLGGDLFSLLHKQKGKRFDEKDAKFLSACVLEALEHLHSKGVVYRDLKPENLLIDRNGYIKLTDFGFAKKMPARGKTFTFAGTPEYVAPEIVLNRGHDKAVDYWAFGVFVFELLTGRTPFRTGDSSHMRTYNKILNGIDNVNFPPYMNPRARNLIEKLCRPVPAERMGMQRGGTRDIKAHKWYQGFDWVRFQQCQMPSSFKPKLKDVTDTSNFDLFKQDKDYPPDETSGWDIHF